MNPKTLINLCRAVCLTWLFMLTACHAQTEEQKRMKHIQTVEINYGVIGSNYNIDNKGHVDVEDIEGQNYMLDAEGKEVKRWFGTGGGSWGKGNIPIGGSKSPARLPKTVHLGYYDTVEQQAYTAEFELPQERIYELMQLKTMEDSSPTKPIPRFDHIMIGIAPKGYIMVWLYGYPYGDHIEIGQYWAKPIPFDLNAYNNTHSLEIWPNVEQIYWKDNFAPETIARLKQGWKPDYQHYEQIRTLYPWRLELKAPWVLTEYTALYAAGGQEVIFPWRMKEEAPPKLRGVPETLIFYFNDPKGQRYELRMDFYNKNRVSDEADVGEVWNALRQVFPDRTYKDNDKPVREEDMARMELEIDEPMDNIYVHLVKGNQRIRIPVYEETLKVLNPYEYVENPTKSRTPEEIRALQYGPQSKINLKVKIGEVCPQTGYWSCEYLSSKEGLFMRAGDRMPGQSAVARGDVSADTLWTLVKPEG